jgi:cytidine deaminase
MSDWTELVAAAEQAMASAYAPYSGFRVGAALECEDGTVFVGANVENSSFGLTICAERSAVVTAVTHGKQRFSRIAIRTEAEEPVAPCGACRQFLSEFAPNLQVLSVYSGGQTEWTLRALLPVPFHLGGE